MFHRTSVNDEYSKLISDNSDNLLLCFVFVFEFTICVSLDAFAVCHRRKQEAGNFQITFLSSVSFSRELLEVVGEYFMRFKVASLSLRFFRR
jgi:hypothetical protein